MIYDNLIHNRSTGDTVGAGPYSNRFKQLETAILPVMRAAYAEQTKQLRIAQMQFHDGARIRQFEEIMNLKPFFKFWGKVSESTFFCSSGRTSGGVEITQSEGT